MPFIVGRLALGLFVPNPMPKVARPAAAIAALNNLPHRCAAKTSCGTSVPNISTSRGKKTGLGSTVHESIKDCSPGPTVNNTGITKAVMSAKGLADCVAVGGSRHQSISPALPNNRGNAVGETLGAHDCFCD